MIDSYAGVPYTYRQQIGDLNLAKQWKQIDIPVLVIYSTSDPATSASEGRYLVDIVNSFHPGRATYMELAGMGHDYNRYASQLEFLTRRRNPQQAHPFDQEFADVVTAWLGRHSQS
jgi:pimeloyl-ACP methyl ester carboxylesterase